MTFDFSRIITTSAQILARSLPSYQRYLLPKLDSGSRLIGIKGARGAGKSTLMLQHAKAALSAPNASNKQKLSANQLLYISCDHPALAGANLYEIAEAFYARGGKLLLVDEIHKAKNFSQELKAIYDVFDLQVIFSGSSAIELEHAHADLSRRAVVHKLGVLSLREFCEMELGLSLPSFSLNDLLANHTQIASELMTQFRPLEQFHNYLNYGCYPFYRESLQDYPLKLQEVISQTIDSDLSRIFNIEASKLDKLKKVLYMLCATNPYELNISKLSAAVEVSRPTLYNYLHYMDAGSLIHSIRASKGMRTVNKPDKLLLHNPNLFKVLCGEANLGSLRESFFVSQLSLQHQVHYHDQGDFLLDDKLVFEIGGASKTRKQLKGIKPEQAGYVAADDIEVGLDNTVPMWLFGFLY